MSFAQGARLLAGAAGRVLLWSPATFWQSTPAELAAILDPDPDTQGEGMSRATMKQMMESDPDGR
ncbi:MAG: phage tail assembly chaperone [Alteraurantiacibacter sp.]